MWSGSEKAVITPTVELAFLVLYSKSLLLLPIQDLFVFQDQNVLVWENPTKRVLVVTRNGHEDVKRFWKRYKQDSS